MAIQEIIQFTQDTIKKFGGKSDDPNKNFVFRNNTKSDALEEGGAYFGIIRPEEEPTGSFHDFCLVIFPDLDDGQKPWLLSLGIGTLGFLNDYDLSLKPGLRRMYESILSASGFCKTDLSDTEKPLPIEFQEKLPHLAGTLSKYSKVLPVCDILNNPLSDESKDRIAGFIAIYAKARGWIKHKYQRKEYEKVINKLKKVPSINDEEKVLDLILHRKFVILTGAPGTGKTRMAKIIQKKLDAVSFFIQFHAETDYSDFIYGIVPNLSQNNLGYSAKFGKFYESLKYASENPEKKVLLIVDEINRANLANILGPIFYLFEYRLTPEEASETIEICPGLSINKIPDNFFMIGTMNTADRSLAVVDFALRRRFAWYDLKPQLIDQDYFFKEDFSKIQEIFFWHANSEELNLQPGQGYFLADNEDEFKFRVEFELLPLIKEYLQEQLLLPAKEDFNDYFYSRIGKNLFS